MGAARIWVHSLCAVLIGLFLACSPPAALPKEGAAGPGSSKTPSPSTKVDTPSVLSTTGAPVAEGPMERVPAQVAELAQQLVAGKTTDRDKALALYDWVAKNVRYDIAAYLANDLPDPSPDVVLASRLTVCEGYSRLFMAMAQSVGLEAVMIPGFSKGFSPDEDKSEPDHAWNAVKLDGNWALLDSTWGAGHIDESKNFVAEYTRDWFDVKPEQFAATHLPEDAKWQLVDPAVSAADFWARPSLSNIFFDYGLTLDSHQKGHIKSDGPFQLDVSAAKDCRLMARLYRDAEELPGDHTLVERKGQSFRIWVWPPAPGQYRLLIFAGPPKDIRTESAVVYDLKASAGSQGEQFPKTLKTFTDQQVHLVEPRSGLRQGESTEMVVEAPGANKMMAVVGEEQIAFERDGERFTVQLTPRGEKVRVFGGYDESRQMDGLLEFPVSR